MSDNRSDHHLDAIRYAIMYLQSERKPKPWYVRLWAWLRAQVREAFKILLGV